MDKKRFLKDRKIALLSMNRAAIMRYCKKYNIEMPVGETFWAGIHKARTGALDLPEEEREKSKQWLFDNGYTPLD